MPGLMSIGSQFERNGLYCQGCQNCGWIEWLADKWNARLTKRWIIKKSDSYSSTC